MGWPPKFGVVGRASSLQAKGRRLDSPRARLKLGPDFQRVALLETEPRFPALRRGNWGPISRKIVESCGVPSNFSMRDTFLLGREIFRANIIGKVDWSLSMQLTFCNKKAGMAFYSLSHHCSRIFTSRIWNHSATKAVKKKHLFFSLVSEKRFPTQLKIGLQNQLMNPLITHLSSPSTNKKKDLRIIGLGSPNH